MGSDKADCGPKEEFGQLSWLTGPGEPENDEGSEGSKRFRRGGRREADPGTSGRKATQPPKNPEGKGEPEADPAELLDFYQVLEVSPEADAGAVRRAYLEKVRRYPPETHPTEFQAVRRAYENLSDPAKRRDYDFIHAHGEQAHKLLERAEKYLNRGKPEKSIVLLEKLLALAPRQPHLHALLGIAAVLAGDGNRFEQAFALAEQCAQGGEELALVLVQKAGIFLELDRAAEAVAALERLAGKVSREEMRPHHGLVMDAYRATKRWKDALGYVDRMLAPPVQVSASEVTLLVILANLFLESGRWDLLAKAKRRLDQALRALKNEVDRREAKKLCVEEYEEWFKAASCREAAFFVDLAVALDPKDEELRAAQRRVRGCIPVQEELDRLGRDLAVLPLVQHQAIKAFFSWLELEWDEEENGLRPGVMAGMERRLEDYAAGIMRVKKKYPLVYALHRAFWDEKLAELTSGWNRETRRAMGIR